MRARIEVSSASWAKTAAKSVMVAHASLAGSHHASRRFGRKLALRLDRCNLNRVSDFRGYLCAESRWVTASMTSGPISFNVSPTTSHCCAPSWSMYRKTLLERKDRLRCHRGLPWLGGSGELHPGQDRSLGYDTLVDRPVTAGTRLCG